MKIKASSRIQALNPNVRMSQPMSGSNADQPEQFESYESYEPEEQDEDLGGMGENEGAEPEDNTAVQDGTRSALAKAARRAAAAKFHHDLKADLKQLRMDPAMYTPGSLKIKAATRLMARATQVSRVAEKGMREIVQQMIKLGYTADTTQNKALYTTVFTKEVDGEEEQPHTFQMVGWHGTGRYGAEKTILEFYDDEKDPKKPVVTIGVINDENINPAKQMEVVTHILDYVKHHG